MFNDQPRGVHNSIMEMENNFKYIVYITTNLVNKKIYIGVHKTTTPFHFDGYLGNGVRIQDKHTYKFSKTPFQMAVNKYGVNNFLRKTIKVFDTLSDALSLEKVLVNEEFIKRNDTYNIALGGGLPLVPTKTIYQYTLEGVFIKEWPSITEASIYYKCSNSTIGKAIFDRTPSVGFLWTDYKYEKIELNSFKIDENKTVVYIYDTNGVFIEEFKSIGEASRKLQIDVQTISKSIRGKYCVNKQYYCSDIKYDIFPIPPKTDHKKDKLYQYDLQGNFIKEWENYNEVKKFFKKDIGIHAAIRLNNSCMGYQWSWEKLPNMKALSPKTKARKVGKYTMEGELIQIFNTVRAAKADTCGAARAVKGLRKSAGGYLWKYIE